MEIAWGIVGIVATLLVGTGVSVLGFSPPEYLIARACFYSSAAILAITCMAWELRTDSPDWWRITAGALVCICVGIGLPTLLSWVDRRQSGAVSTKLKVVSLAFASPHFAAGLPIAVRVNFKNVYGKALKIRNAAWMQTRLIPANLAAEKENEDSLWRELVERIKRSGRDAEIPMVEGEMNPIFETNPLLPDEFASIMTGTHAVYFAVLTIDRETQQHLMELCFFVSRDGRIQYCSQYNGP